MSEFCYLTKRNQQQKALKCLQAEHKRLSMIHGPDDPATLIALHNFGAVCAASYRYEEAINTLRQVVDRRVAVFGRRHEGTLPARRDLAEALAAAYRFAEAIAEYEELYDDNVSVFGPDHPRALVDAARLFQLIHEIGHPGEAAAEMAALLPVAERVFGVHAPFTLTLRNNLAYGYRSAGRLGEAIPLYERTLADRERVLGPDHPDTLASRNNLAAGYRWAGRLGEAIPLYERTLADRERVLGANDPTVAVVLYRHRLASAQLALGDAFAAAQALRRAARIDEAACGDDYPAVAIEVEAEQWYRRAVERDDVAAMANLAVLLETGGEQEMEAEPDKPDKQTEPDEQADADRYDHRSRPRVMAIALLVSALLSVGVLFAMIVHGGDRNRLAVAPSAPAVTRTTAPSTAPTCRDNLPQFVHTVRTRVDPDGDELYGIDDVSLVRLGKLALKQPSVLEATSLMPVRRTRFLDAATKWLCH